VITMDGLIRPTVHLVHEEPDQVPRLARFREAHPGVVVGAGRGWWQAVIPEADGERVVTRYTLHELLDKLDELKGGGLSTGIAPTADIQLVQQPRPWKADYCSPVRERPPRRGNSRPAHSRGARDRCGGLTRPLVYKIVTGATKTALLEHPGFHAHLVLCDAASPGGSAVMRLPGLEPGPVFV
jgi:hypothetical protein